MAKQGIKLQLYEIVDSIQDTVTDRIEKAFLSTALATRDKARTLLVNNPQGYKLTPLKDAIIAGKFINKNNVLKIKVVGLGTRQDPESYKARFFIGGTKPRFTRNYSKYRGQLSPNNAVIDALDESLLVQKIQNAINNITWQDKQ